MRATKGRSAAISSALAGVCTVFTAPAVQAEVAPVAASIIPRPDGVEVRRAGATMRSTAIEPAFLRIRIGRDGVMPKDAGWAVSAAARARRAPVRAQADGFTTAAMRVRIHPATLRLVVEHPAGKVISADTIDPVRLDGRGFTRRADAAARTLTVTIPDQPRASETIVAHR